MNDLQTQRLMHAIWPELYDHPDDTHEHTEICAPTSYYRIRTGKHPKRHVRHTWYGRRWQAEWDGCRWAPRAYTRRGIERRSARWRDKGWPTDAMIARRRWVRRNITRRGES